MIFGTRAAVKEKPVPSAKYYVVEQTRSVKVTANNEASAFLIAQAAFATGQTPAGKVVEPPPNVWGDTTSKIEVDEVRVRRNA